MKRWHGSEFTTVSIATLTTFLRLHKWKVRCCFIVSALKLYEFIHTQFSHLSLLLAVGVPFLHGIFTGTNWCFYNICKTQQKGISFITKQCSMWYCIFFKFIGWLDTLILPYVIVCFVYLHPPRLKKNNNMT